MTRENKRYPFEMALFLIAYYVANNMFQSYMSLYYTDIGFNSTQIGMVTACVSAVSLFAQPVWGICGDRARDRRSVVALLSFLSAFCICAVKISTSFFLTALWITLFAIFYTSVQPMGDAIILQKLENNRQPFGPIRLAASLSFAISGIFFGRMFDHGLQPYVPIFTGVLCILLALSVTILPKTPGGQHAGKRMSFGALLKNRELLRLLLFALPMMITMGYFYTFFSPLFVSLPNASSKLLGWAYFISAGCEFPFLINSDRLFDRFGAGKLMCVSGVLLTLRWILLATTDSFVVAMFSQICHGGGFIVISVCLSKYIARTVPIELKASGQLLLSMVTYGIARTVGNICGGVLADAIGTQEVFFICAAICLASLLIFAPYYLRRKPMNGTENSSLDETLSA